MKTSKVQRSFKLASLPSNAVRQHCKQYNFFFILFIFIFSFFFFSLSLNISLDCFSSLFFCLFLPFTPDIEERFK